MDEGFEKCDHEHTLFIKTRGKDNILMVSDDLNFFIGNNELMLADYKNIMKLEFDMVDLGEMKYFLGLEVVQKSDGIFISPKRSMYWLCRKDLA